jgi:oligoendopeptidase F
MDLSSVQQKVSIEEAKKYVLEALSILGDEYVNNLKKAFNEK